MAVPKMNLDRKEAPKARESDLNMNPDGNRFGTIQFMLQPGHTIEDVLHSEFWAQVAHNFTRPSHSEGNYAGSIIEIRNRENTVYVDLWVLAVMERGLLVEIMKPDADGVCRFGPKEVIRPEDFEARWNVSKKGFDIIRLSDNEIVGDGKNFPTKKLVNDWIDKTAGA